MIGRGWLKSCNLFAASLKSIDEDSFLRIVYFINGRSFQGLEEYKKIALDTLQNMVAIHIEATEAEKKAWNGK